MREILDVGLPSIGQPFSWAVRFNNLVFTSHGPVTAEGKILQADIVAQTRLTLGNLRMALQAAGGTLDDVMQVQIMLLDVADMKPVDTVYAEFFNAPFPSRSTAIVAGLVAPGMRIELAAIAALSP